MYNNKNIKPTFGLSFGLPSQGGGGYPINPYGPHPLVNPYGGSIGHQGINLGLVSVNPLISLQVTKDDYGAKVFKPFVNLHVTPNNYLLHKFEDLFAYKKVFNKHKHLHFYKPHRHRPHHKHYNVHHSSPVIHYSRPIYHKPQHIIHGHPAPYSHGSAAIEYDSPPSGSYPSDGPPGPGSYPSDSFPGPGSHPSDNFPGPASYPSDSFPGTGSYPSDSFPGAESYPSDSFPGPESYQSNEPSFGSHQPDLSYYDDPHNYGGGYGGYKFNGRAYQNNTNLVEGTSLFNAYQQQYDSGNNIYGLNSELQQHENNLLNYEQQNLGDLHTSQISPERISENISNKRGGKSLSNSNPVKFPNDRKRRDVTDYKTNKTKTKVQYRS